MLWRTIVHWPRRLRWGLFATVLMALTLPSSTRSAAAAPITVTYLSTQHTAAIQPVIDQFNKTHPGIHVVMQNLPFDQIFQQIQVRLSSGSSSPDVLDVDAPVVAAYGIQGFLAPLDAVFSKHDLAELIPAELRPCYYQGHLLALPINSSSQVLFYNKDLLKKAGIPFPPNDVHKRLTWQQVATDARKATFRSHGQVTAWGFLIDQIDRPYQLLPLPESLGGRAISEDGLSVNGIITAPPWITAFTWYYNLFNTWKVSPTGATPAQTAPLFASGHAALFWGESRVANLFTSSKDLHWGFAPTPYFAGGKPVTPTDSWHLGVNRHSHNFAAAAEFVRYMTLGPGNDLWAKETAGFVPALVREARRIETDPATAAFPGNVQRLAVYEATHTAIPRPVTPGFTEYQNILTQAFDNIRSGQSAQAALSAAASQIDSALLKYRRAPH